MIINKVRIANEFKLDLVITTKADSHGKFSDKMDEIDQIVNASLDSLKVHLSTFIVSIPDKVG